MMKYISPGSWFSLEYPSAWHEFEDEENSFLFYNPDKWTGNFRISAFRGEKNDYARTCIDYELNHTPGAKRLQVGEWDCAYLTESFQENGAWYVSHVWVTGKDSVSVTCTFTVAKGDSPKEGENIVRSLRVKSDTDRPWKEIIPVRVLEINTINEYYEWAASTIKKQLAKDFTASEKDIDNLCKVMESGRINKNQRQAWESFGIAFGVILVNEMDGMEWVTVIDGRKEYPALRFAGTNVMVYPLDLVWNNIRNGRLCDLRAEYNRIKAEVESAM